MSHQDVSLPIRRKSTAFLGSLAAWAGRSIGLRDGRFWSLLFQTESWAGKSVTPETALNIAAYWACLRLLSTTIATLPWGVYARKGDQDRQSLTDHPLYEVLHNAPNANQTAVEFWEEVVGSLLMYGNHVSEKLYNSVGQLIGLRPLMSPFVTVKVGTGGALQYEYRDPRTQVVERFTADQVLHIRGFSLGGELGLSPLHYAKQSLGTALAVDESAARTFSNGMRPGGFFLYDKVLEAPQRKRLEEILIHPNQGAENQGKIGILEAGLKWQDVQMPPEAAQMLQTRGFHVEEVCRWFGVPPVLIGHSAQGQTMWGSGIEQILTAWYALGLRPIMQRLEQAVRRSCISVPDRAKGIYAEINFEALLRADSAARAEFYSKMVQNGIMTRNEIRAKENLPRHPDGDALTAQVNLSPLGQLGQAGTPAATEAVRQAILMLLKAGMAEAA